MKRLLLIALVGLLASVSAPAIADGPHTHFEGCDESHPEVLELKAEVRKTLTGPLRNLAAIVSAGFVPYFDAVVPYGNPKDWPAGIETGLPYFNTGHPDPETWVKHYINPWWMDDEYNLDPERPEALLLDQWDRPIGVMFIAPINTEGDDLYVNEDGTPCRPWHAHTDEAAVYAFWGYNYLFHGDSERPEKTPPMMHVWMGSGHPTFAHEYPPADDPERKGPPPPLPWQCTPTMETGPAGAICS